MSPCTRPEATGGRWKMEVSRVTLLYQPTNYVHVYIRTTGLMDSNKEALVSFTFSFLLPLLKSSSSSAHLNSF